MNVNRNIRKILDLSKFGINIFSEFGYYNYFESQTPLVHHTHKDSLEICLLVNGSQSYVVKGETYTMHGGDIFIAFPDEIHGTGSALEQKGKLYWMVIERPSEINDFLGLKPYEATEIFDKLCSLPNRLFHGVKYNIAIMQEIFNLSDQPVTPLNVIKLKHLLIEFLLKVISAGEDLNSRQYSETIDKAVRYFNDNIFGNLKLSDVADMYNLSLSRFKHLFKEEVGISPSQYIMRQKLIYACNAIESKSESLKNLAYDLGFSSPAHFTTAFKQYYRVSPTQYRAMFADEY